MGLKLYFAGLCGVSIDALRGPQVRADGAALVGRVPSELEQYCSAAPRAGKPLRSSFICPERRLDR
jgi:hypothetical protein